MKRILLILALLLPLAAAAQSPLYERYAQRKDLTVAQVSGFKLNDSTRVDVVLIVADDNAAWRRLLKELDTPAGEGTTSWLAHPEEPAKRTRWDGQPVLRVVASHQRRTLGLYRIDTERQYDALLDYQMNQMQQQEKRGRRK